MSEVLKKHLEDYIEDTRKFHDEHHTGKIEECPVTGCRLAVDLSRGHVGDDVYRAIVEGKEKVE